MPGVAAHQDVVGASGEDTPRRKASRCVSTPGGIVQQKGPRHLTQAMTVMVGVFDPKQSAWVGQRIFPFLSLGSAGQVRQGSF